jgi:hypothetical protein
MYLDYYYAILCHLLTEHAEYVRKRWNREHGVGGQTPHSQQQRLRVVHLLLES